MLKPLKLSIRNWDVIDLETVRGSSNFRKAATGMEAGTGDGEREKLKFFPIRKLQVMNCEALRIFLLDFGSRLVLEAGCWRLEAGKEWIPNDDRKFPVRMEKNGLEAVFIEEW